MGGIFGVVCEEQVPRGVIYEGLRRLVYRGYDGAGVAILRGSTIEVRKAPGHLNEVSKKIDFVNIDSSLAIGHTRYASRGWPVYENTHPLVDCRGEIAVVGDGIIENYEDIKTSLEKRNHKFRSRTDTEVAAHLLEENLSKGLGVIDALVETASILSGNYALVFIRAPDAKIYIVQRGQLLVIGVSYDKKCVYVSSDLPSLYGFAEVAYIVEDDTVGSVSYDSIELYSIQYKSRVELSSLQYKRVKYPPEFVEKGGYPHFMLKEIHEVPEALARTTIAIMEKYLRLASMIVQGARKVFVIGTGTSLHASLTSTYYFSELAGISVVPVSAAEFPYSMLDSVETGTVIIAISQSGETSDVITSIKLAKQRGAVIIGITNNVGSRLALESNVYLPIGAGPELAVPATKTFTSTLATLLILASYTGVFTGKRSIQEHRKLVEELKAYSKKLNDYMLTLESQVVKVVDAVKESDNMYIASSGITYPIAVEGALKLKEAALIHAEGLQLGELRHGPLSIIRPGFPVILVEPYEEQAHSLYLKVLEELDAKQANVISMESRLRTKYRSIEILEAMRYLYPISAVVALQLLAYYMGVAKNAPIDTPPGLAKTITT